MADIIQIRRDTSPNWTTADPILAEGELGLETDTNNIKVGDGVSNWSGLTYAVTGSSGVTEDQSVVNFTGDLQNNGLSVLTEDSSGDLDMNGNKVLFANVYSTEGDLPSATTYHGMFAHVHGTGEAYFAHAGNWVQLAKQTEVDSIVDSSGDASFTGEISAVDGAFSGEVSAVDGDFSGSLKATTYEETFSAVTSSTGSAILDCTLGNVFEHVLIENTTFVFAIPAGVTTFGFSLGIQQDVGASGYLVTWPSTIKWPNATAPTLTGTASAIDQFVFYTHDGGTTWYGFTSGLGLA